MANLSIAVLTPQTVTTAGAKAALGFVSRMLLQARRCARLDKSRWAVEFARLAAQGVPTLLVPSLMPRHADEPNITILAQHWRLQAPKLAVSVSALHHPTGAPISPASAPAPGVTAGAAAASLAFGAVRQR